MTESKIVRRNKTRRCIWEMKVQMSSGSTLLVVWNGGHFLHSVLIVYCYLWTTIAVVFCQAAVFFITAVFPRRFMIICEISCVWKKAVCSKFVYWRVVARLFLRKEGWEHRRDQFSENQNAQTTSQC